MQINHTKLHDFIKTIFTSAGSNPTEAEHVAFHLISANLAGHDSHGVIRTPIYIQWLGEGKVFANREIKVLLENETMAVIDGQLGLGQSIGVQAMGLGFDKCRRFGVAVVAIRNSGHLGRIGHWAEMAINEGFVSLNFVGSTGLGMCVVPTGGSEPRMSINPVTIGVPNRGRPPVVFDIAAAATAEGKLKVARNKGVHVPEGWILDAQGRPTTDPNDFYGPPRGAILPFGGHKGYGLCLMAELLAGAITGGGCSRPGITLLEQNMLSILIDPTKLQPENELYDEVRRYVDFVRTSKPTEPDGQVMAPGDIEERNRQERMRDGIPLDDNTWGQLVEAAEKCEVSRDVIDGVMGQN